MFLRIMKFSSSSKVHRFKLCIKYSLCIILRFLQGSIKSLNALRYIVLWNCPESIEKSFGYFLRLESLHFAHTIVTILHIRFTGMDQTFKCVTIYSFRKTSRSTTKYGYVMILMNYVGCYYTVCKGYLKSVPFFLKN